MEQTEKKYVQVKADQLQTPEQVLNTFLNAWKDGKKVIVVP